MRKRDLSAAYHHALEENDRLQEERNRARDQAIIANLRVRAIQREREKALQSIDILLGSVNPLTQTALSLHGIRADLVATRPGDIR